LNGWDFTLDALGRYFDRVITSVAQDQSAAIPHSESVKLLQSDVPPDVTGAIGTYLESARLLGVRTAELHKALASNRMIADFSPEPSTPHHRRAVFQSMRNIATQNMRLLRRQLNALPPETIPLARRIAELEPVILDTFRALSNQSLSGQRIRLHGDCRLGQVLWTGKDFLFMDFEGDGSVPISERRLNHSPMRDVAAMVRSFHYAAAIGLNQHVKRGSIPPENMPRYQSWVRYWYLWVSVAFLKAYFQTIAGAGILPDNEEALRVLLRAHLLNKAMVEVGGQIREGSPILDVPLTAILTILREPIPNPTPAKDQPPPATATH
jgi:maltose alpha-D-glucosyltransferase/alpha-amylase